MIDDDREMERLEALLSVYRFRGGVAPRMRSPRWRWPLAIAAALLAATIGVVDWFLPRPNDWRANAVAGAVDVPRVLRAGDVIRTGSGGRVRLQADAVGVIDVGERTTVRLIESRDGRHRLSLDAGTIHARTSSPPGVFIVDTPRARAIDLGCEYTLTIAADGGGLLRVASGWVQLQRGSVQSLVPQGAAAMIDNEGVLTAPYFEDAPLEFQAAVQGFSFGRAEDLQRILAGARRRDALTLINLFSRATPEERGLIFDRLNQLVPAPPSVTVQSVEGWWPAVLKASGVGPIKKKKGMPPRL